MADVICFVTTNVSAINHPGIWQWCIARGVAVIAGATIGYVCLKYSILRETWSWGPGTNKHTQMSSWDSLIGAEVG